MRDGLHKDLPLGRAWQGFVKACEREAERGEPARTRATHALLADFRQEVSPTFVRQLVQGADESASLLPTFKAFGPTATSRKLAGANSPLENEILANARRLEEEGLRGPSLAQQACEQALRSRSECRVRQIEQHCRAEQAARVGRAARDAIASVNLTTIVEPLLQDSVPPSAPKKRPIELDEDLSRPR